MSLEPTAPRPAPAFTADEERPVTGRPFLVRLYVPHFTARSLPRMPKRRSSQNTPSPKKPRHHVRDSWTDPHCRIGLRMGGAAFAVFVGFLLDALVGHGEVGLPGHAVVVGHLPGRLYDVRAAEPCGGALREILVQADHRPSAIVDF